MKPVTWIGRPAVVAACLFVSVATARADTPLLIAKEGGTLAEISTVTTNAVGGFVSKFNYNAAGTNGTAVLYGSATRTPGAALRTEGAFGGFTQLNFFSESINNTGALAYTAPGASSTFAVYSGDTLLASTGTAIASGPLAGKFVGNALSNAAISTAGTVTYTIDYRDTAAGAQSGKAIVTGTGTTVLLKTGDTIAGAGSGSAGSGNTIVAPMVAADNASVILDTSSIANTSVSTTGNHYVTTADVGRDIRVPTGGTPAFSTQSPADDLVLVTDGSAVTTAGGGIIRKGETFSVAAGGLGNGETIRSFGSFDVNTGGTVAGYVNLQAGGGADDYCIFVGSSIIAREHTSYNGVALGDIGLSPSLDLNDSGDYVFSFGTQLFVDGQRVIGAGDLIDTDGDGVADTALSGNIATNGLAIGGRLPDGSVDVYFTGRISGSTVDYLYRVNVPVPEPTSLGLAAVSAAALLRRRRA